MNTATGGSAMNLAVATDPWTPGVYASCWRAPE